MLKLNKKGFTVVELVIVIAVVAILAAVLIPTFINLMQTANESADIQLVTNLNKIMAMQEALDGKNATMQDALDDAFANGYDISKISPTSKGNDIVWDQTADRFALVNAAEKKLIFRDDATPIEELETGKNYTLWKIYTEAPGESDPGFSIYWNGSSAPSFTTLTVGFDAGKCTGIETLSYVRANTEAAQDVIFRTNGGDLTVNAGNDTVKHYGEVNNVTITAVAGDSYHEFGKVSGKIKITAGRFVDETGMISNITVLGAGVKIDTTRTDLLVINFGGNAASVTLNNTEMTKDDGSSILAVKDGKVESAAVITTLEQLQSAFKKGGYVVLGADISSPKKQLRVEGGIELTIDLNGYTISGCTSYSSIAVKGKLTINGQGTVKSDSQLYSLFYVYEYSNARGELIINGGNYELLKINTGYNKAVEPLIRVGDESYREGAPDNDYRGGFVTINGGNFTAREFCVGVMSQGELTINGGTFTSLNNAVIGTIGNKGLGKNKLTINGGTFNGSIESEDYIACGIYLANNDTLTVNGGTFNITNGVGILVRSGKATIGKDVVIHATGIDQRGKVGDAATKIDAGHELVIDYTANYPGDTPSLDDSKSVYTKYEIK